MRSIRSDFNRGTGLCEETFEVRNLSEIMTLATLIQPLVERLDEHLHDPFLCLVSRWQLVRQLDGVLG